MVARHHVAVAYSGGRDSTALLHATACAARDAGDTHVWALHVHHGLSAHAEAWLAHAEATCATWARQGLPVSLVFQRVHVQRNAGDSVEAQARAARHAALARMCREAGADLLLLAHHRRDQAETFLLQALRGASVAGLAAMPREALRDGVHWVRPWLDHPREAIEAYIAAHDLAYIEDDSNADPRYARNRLRLAVWPALAEAFPQVEQALAQSARQLADVLEPLEAWGAAVLPASVDASGHLCVAQWCAQSPAARRELLRRWYAHVSGGRLSASWLARLSDELPALAQAQRPAHWAELGLSLYRGVLRWAEIDPDAGLPQADDQAPVTLPVTGPGVWPVTGWGGALQVMAATSGGVPVSLLGALRVQARRGGEQWQAGPGRPARALKKQFQAAGVPPWARAAPLFYAGEQLVYVPGLGVDARVMAAEGEPQWALNWLPNHA